ncbi:MAG: histidine--tRNA ligase [Flavobacteriaceae bacterium]|nr:histidine--tRNA ligase [Flavobacteriaceae bacterium]
MAQKPSLAKGTRDFLPNEINRRNFIMETIKNNFKLFGFEPIETPSFEKSETLMGKYGEEGDRLIFKILNSGDYLKKVSEEALSEKNLKEITSKITEKALRYDLTVPFARYVVQHQNELVFPFKRYQIQPVWRADKPQKGRFREFFQCDADVVGSESLLQEIDFIQLYDSVFTSLNLKGTTIKINNRKILQGIAEIIGAADKLVDFTVALDKLDKIGKEGIIKEMISKGISENALEKLDPLFSMKGENEKVLESLSEMLSGSEQGMKGIEELSFIVNNINELGLKTSKLEIDLTLARGLNYYTGAIFEVSAPEGVSMGSIGGGGRYADLTAVFGLKDMSGVGISFGLDRIYLVMEELDLFQDIPAIKPQVLFMNFEEKNIGLYLKTINQLRKENISSELYPDFANNQKKQKKQWKYADNRQISLIISEVKVENDDDIFIVKNTITQKQEKCNFSELLIMVNNL